MVPVLVPIVDYENPFYCPRTPNPLQVHSADVPDSDGNLPISPLSAATLAATYNYEGVKNRNFHMGTSNSSVQAISYGRNRVTNYDLSEKPVVGRKSARITYDSSPCARFLSSLEESDPAHVHARYTNSARESFPFGVPDREGQEPCSIKQEYSSPVFPAFSDQDERIHQVLNEGREKIPECGVEGIVTTRTLLLRIDEFFPQIGFREAADSVQTIWPETNAQYRSERHQALVDLLAERGALNEYVLTALYDAEFRHLDLGPTMRGVNELNLPRGDVMRVFGQSGWFRHLKTLSFAGGRFRDDFALAHIQSLRQIEKLVLANTGIGNEGVFHIVALKHKLRHLDLSENLSINDDSIPALILLENLQHLSIFGTGVLMPGLRKLAVAIKGGEHVVDIKIPSVCKDYLDGMHEQYLLHPLPPLISDPGIISILSKTALSRNLMAHAAINSGIVCTGPRDEMEERLRKILDARNLDLVVQEMLAGRDS